LTYNTGNDGSLGPLISKRLFISDSILDNHNSGIVLIHGRGNRFDCGILIDSLVGTDNVVVRLAGFGGGLEYFFRDNGVFAMVLGVHYQALSSQ
jgi:hypothetical protein